MKVRQHKGIIFDCDGVLFDSHPANLAYYNTVLAELGAPLVTADEQDKAYLCHTACSKDVFHELVGPDRTPEALAIAHALDYRQFIPYLKPYEGMLEVLPELASSFPLGLATNRTSSVHQLLEHFGIRNYFKVVVTSSDVPLPKPDPEMLHLAARRLGLANSDLVFVGDADSDRQAALASGTTFIGFGEGSQAGTCVSGWQEIAEWSNSY